MEKLKPFTSKKAALHSLDNGGRFYNFLTEKNDGIISDSEIGKVGGLFGDKQKLMLFLELSLSKLSTDDQISVLSMFDDELKSVYQKYKAQYLLPSEALSRGIISSNAIITGYPKKIDSHSDFTGFILIPIMTGTVTTFVMIPIIEQYDIYELHDEKSSETFLIAHAKESVKLPERKIIVAGVLKELKSSKDEKIASNKFLEAVYFLDDE